MKTITTKTAKNGVRNYYVDGKRVSRDKAIEAATENRNGATFAIEAESKMYFYFVSEDLGKSGDRISTSRYEVKTLKTRIDSYGGKFTVKIGEYGGHDVHVYYDKASAQQLIGLIEDAFFAGADGFKITLDNKFSILEKEFDASEYAVSEEAFAIAVDAEISAARGVSTFSEVKKLCVDVQEFNFGSDWNAEIKRTCDLLLKMANQIEQHELEGWFTDVIGRPFENAVESSWAGAMSGLGDTLKYKGVDEKAYINAVWTHDLDHCSYNRRGLAHFINMVIQDSDLTRHFAHFLKETSNRTIADYVIAIDTAEEINTANEPIAPKGETEMTTTETELAQEIPETKTIVIERDEEKMTIGFGKDTGKAKAKKYFVDGMKVTKGQAELIVRSYVVQAAVEAGAIIEIDTRLANEFDAIAKTPYKGEFTLIHVDAANGKSVKDDAENMFTDFVDTAPHHVKISMFGDKVPMFEIIWDGRNLPGKRGGHLSQKEVDEWIIQAYQQRKQYPNLTIEVPDVVAALYLDSLANNPRIVRELYITLTPFSGGNQNDATATADSAADKVVTVTKEELSFDERAAAYAGITVEEFREQTEAILAEIRCATHGMEVRSLKKQIAAAEQEVTFLVKNINYDVWDYLRGNPNDDVSEVGVNNCGESLVDAMQKLAELKAQLAKLAPTEVTDDAADEITDATELEEIINTADNAENEITLEEKETTEMTTETKTELPTETKNEVDAEETKTATADSAATEDSEATAETKEHEVKHFVTISTEPMYYDRANLTVDDAKELYNELEPVVKIVKGKIRRNDNLVTVTVPINTNPQVKLVDRIEDIYEAWGAHYRTYYFTKDVTSETSKPATKETMPMETIKNELPKGTIEVATSAEAFEIAVNAEICAADKDDNDADTVWNLIPELDELNDVDDSADTAETADAIAVPSAQAAPPADDFAAKLAELKAAADKANAFYDAKLAELNKAKEIANAADRALEKFYDENARALKHKWDAAFGDKQGIELVNQNGYGCNYPILSDLYIDGFSIFGKFRIVNDRNKSYGEYDTPAQVEKVIEFLKVAIERGDEQFTFPTIEELKPSTFEIVPDAEWTGITGDKYFRIGDDIVTFDKAGRFVEVFSKKYGGIVKRDGSCYYKNKSDNPDTTWEVTRHKCPKKLFYQIMTARADKDNVEEAPDAVQVAKDYLQTVDKVKAQIAADDDFDYVAAKEHIENVYENIQMCIDYWGYYNDLTPEQSEKIYIALHIDSDYDKTDSELRDKLVEKYERQNQADSLTRAMKENLERIQDFCRVKNLPAANNELALYNICGEAFQEIVGRATPSEEDLTTK